jgi:type I restriction enzyme, R subunit
VLPNTKAIKYQGDLKLFNEIKLRARNAFPDDDGLKISKDESITQLELLKAFPEIQDVIIAEQKEGEEKGFKTDRDRAVYYSMKTIFDGDAEDATKTVLDLIRGELNIVGWQAKGQVKKDIENKIMRFLKTKMGRNEARVKPKEMVDVLIRNNNA